MARSWKTNLLKLVALGAACSLLAFGGYELSHLRAGLPSGVREALASAKPLMSASEGRDGDDYRISSLAVFTNVSLHLRDNYVEPERIHPAEMLVAALEEIEQSVAEVLVRQVDAERLSIQVMDETQEVSIADVETLWDISLKLREVFRFFEEQLPPQENARTIEYAAINGALSTLDPHSVLLQPEAFAEMKTSTKGEFGGLGIVISIRDGRLTVISPLADTPAARAGLEAGDVISRIGEVSTISMPIEEAVQMLRGPEGSEVTIWVEREGWSKARRFQVTRERIKIQSVESELLSQDVGYIKIKNFQQNTGQDLEKHLHDLQKASEGELAGLILDLRNNPGGLLEQAIRVSDAFVSSGDIVTTVGYGNQLREPKKARWAGTESKLPLAVLVNRGSASASEIVAGALKNLDRGVLIGERTFGKGSVQVLYDFADSSALKLTIAQYLTPGGISIQSEGVVPDIALEPAVISDDGVRLYYEPDGYRESNLDHHLDPGGRRSFETMPSFQLPFLSSSERPEGEQGPARFDADPVVRFGHAFLLEAGINKRKESLEAGRRFVEKRTKEEWQHIEERLGDRGVDWSPGSSIDPKLEVELSLSETLIAGTDFEVKANIRNLGERPVHRLRGVLDSEHPALEGREFMFGKLEPGATRSWTVKSHVALDTPPRGDWLKLVLSTDEGVLDAGAERAVETEAAPSPLFSYSTNIDDRGRGDGDGRLERGEAVTLSVWVSNEGEGAAHDVVLRLESGARDKLFLERGSDRLGAIEPGKAARGRLEFRVSDEAEGELPLKLTLYDPATGAWLEDQFDLRAQVADDRGARPSPISAIELESPTALRAEASAESRIIASVSPGRLPVTGQVGEDWYAVELEGGMVFVEAKSARPADEAKPLSSWQHRAATIPPRIQISRGEAGVVDVPKLRLQGEVQGPTVRDMFVMVNDQKIYFTVGRESEAPERPSRVPFDVPIQLDEGLNRIHLVARRDENVVSHRTLLITRHSGSSPPVAEVAE
ncbi:MAG: MXAN_5808 family serine peptidase [Myxococcota bacterium]